MSRRRPRPASPLPQRYGVDAVRVKLPDNTQKIGDYLMTRFAASAREVAELFAAGSMVDDAGFAVQLTDPCADRAVWYHRPLRQEPEVPRDLPVLYEDDDVLVVDKPHGLPTTPRGAYVRHSALALLRYTRQEPQLAPAHRLDRLTAGVLMFTRKPELRGRMQRQFQDRQTRKVYEAVVQLFPHGNNSWDCLPTVRKTRIEKLPGNLQSREVEGPINAVTHIAPLTRPWTDSDGTWAALNLRPLTGQTHQLRVHLNAMGMPIRWDPLYPVVTLGTEPDDTVRHPLQLVARSLTVHHPVSRQVITFTSTRTLATL